jgi:hypothetical protein
MAVVVRFIPISLHHHVFNHFGCHVWGCSVIVAHFNVVQPLPHLCVQVRKAALREHGDMREVQTNTHTLQSAAAFFC